MFQIVFYQATFAQAKEALSNALLAVNNREATHGKEMIKPFSDWVSND